MHSLEKDLDVDLSAALVGTTSLADYSFATTQVTFTAGSTDSDTQQLTLTAENDLLIEGDQDINLSVDELDDDFDGQITVTNMDGRNHHDQRHRYGLGDDDGRHQHGRRR